MSCSLFHASRKAYLADAGFGICDSLLVPCRGAHYHLAEWGQANQQYGYFVFYLLVLSI